MPLNVLLPFQLPVPSTTTISELKEMVNFQLGISPARQSLYYKGYELTGEVTLADLEIPADATVILTVGDPIPPTSDHGFGRSSHAIHINQAQGFNSLQGNSAAMAYGSSSLNNIAASSYSAYNQIQQPNAYHSHDQSMHNWQSSVNQLSVTDPTHSEWIDLMVTRAGTYNMMTNIMVQTSETVYNVKKQIEEILGHEISKQQLNDGENNLLDDTLIQDIPKVIESHVVFLSLV